MRLPDVTLIAVSSVKITRTISALRKTYKKIGFGSVKLVSHKRPLLLPSQIAFELCPKLNNIHDYNHYVFREMGRHVETSHCLLIQHDSWVIRPEMWNDDWLKFDYIGAPWPYSSNSYITTEGVHIRVGNGGFSLRSKRILEAPRRLNLHLTHDRGHWNEDGNLCVYHRLGLEKAKIRFAPVEIAAAFSHEHDVPENESSKPFGFHKFVK